MDWTEVVINATRMTKRRKEWMWRKLMALTLALICCCVLCLWTAVW